MAIKRMVIDGYGQVELNQVAFRRDGRIEAQCALDPTDFAKVSAENGMLLAVDNTTRTIKFYKANSNLPIALNYTTEHMYSDKHNALKDFKLDIADGFYPRLGYLSIGDKFTSNCLAYNDTDFDNEDALEQAYNNGDVLYGGVSETGAILVSKTKPTAGPVLKAIKGPGAGSMPDGQFAIKFQVIDC